jgi:8-oxo-dGTP diphosphatase
LEETGHDVSVHKFLGSMAYPADGRVKIVQFWLMRAGALPERELSSDVKAVKWLPLKQAIDLLSRPHEKVFLTHVGPIALEEIKKATHRKTRVTRRTVSKRRPSAAPTTATPHVIAMDYQRTRPSAFVKALGSWFGARRAG